MSKLKVLALIGCGGLLSIILGLGGNILAAYCQDAGSLPNTAKAIDLASDFCVAAGTIGLVFYCVVLSPFWVNECL